MQGFLERLNVELSTLTGGAKFKIRMSFFPTGVNTDKMWEKIHRLVLRKEFILLGLVDRF